MGFIGPKRVTTTEHDPWGRGSLEMTCELRPEICVSWMKQRMKQREAAVLLPALPNPPTHPHLRDYRQHLKTFLVVMAG